MHCCIRHPNEPLMPFSLRRGAEKLQCLVRPIPDRFWVCVNATIGKVRVHRHWAFRFRLATPAPRSFEG
jgi:hypothetical protein